jgi:hypothetical protein
MGFVWAFFLERERERERERESGVESLKTKIRKLDSFLQLSELVVFKPFFCCRNKSLQSARQELIALVWRKSLQPVTIVEEAMHLWCQRSCGPIIVFALLDSLHTALGAYREE